MLANVNARSQDFAERLNAAPFESPAKIRIKGLAIGIEFEDQEYYKGLSDRCLEEGLLVAREAGAFALFPALTIDRQTVLQGLDILERCLEVYVVDSVPERLAKVKEIFASPATSRRETRWRADSSARPLELGRSRSMVLSLFAGRRRPYSRPSRPWPPNAFSSDRWPGG